MNLSMDNIQAAPATPVEEYWTTTDGRQIAVGELDPDHLRNILRLILFRERTRKQEDLRRSAMSVRHRINDVDTDLSEIRDPNK